MENMSLWEGLRPRISPTTLYSTAQSNFMVEFLSEEATSFFFLESAPLVTAEVDGEELNFRWVELFPGIWVEWWLREYTDEEIFGEDPNSDTNAVLLRIMEEKSRSTNSGRVCQLAICPRATERFMVEEGFWDEPQEVGIGELRALFMAYCISINASDRMRIVGHIPCVWDHLNLIKEDPNLGDELREVTPIGQLLRTEGLLGEEMDKSLDIQGYDEARWDVWDAAMLMLTGSETHRYAMFLWNYHRLIVTDHPFERLQYCIAALEALLPTQLGDASESLRRRASILMTPAGEVRRAQGLRRSTYKRDEKEHKKSLNRLLRISNKVKHNITFNEKDWEYFDDLYHVIPYILRAINHTLLAHGKIPSLSEIDQAEGTGFPPTNYEFSYDKEVFNDYDYRWYLHWRPDVTDEYHRLGGREVMPFSDFLDQSITDSEIDKAIISRLKEEPPLEEGNLEVTEESQSAINEEVVPDEDPNQDPAPETESEEECYYERCMLLGVPAILEEGGTDIGWLEVFPGLRIHWSEKTYPDDEVRARCGDNLDFYHFKLMELCSRGTSSGFLCELDIDPEETVRFLNENGMPHLSAGINNHVLYSIFRLFTMTVQAFNGTRMMNAYGRGWTTLLDDFHDERNAKIVPQMGLWTVLMEPQGDLSTWPGQWPEPLIYGEIKDVWNKEGKPILWRAAIMLIEDSIEDGRLARSVDDPLNTFQFSRDSTQKNLAFLQTLVTLLRPNPSKGQRLALVVPAVATVPQQYEEEDWKRFVEEIMTYSISSRNDFIHGRVPDEEYTASLTRHQDLILRCVFATVTSHGGVPDMELIMEAVDTGVADFEREWANRIDQEVIEAEIYRMHCIVKPELIERYDELGGRGTMTYDEFLDSL